MIARIWHGYTKPEHADAYEARQLLATEKGWRRGRVHHDPDLGLDRCNSRRRWTADYETAVIPEKRRKYLSRHDARSVHYEIASLQKPGELSSVIA